VLKRDRGSYYGSSKMLTEDIKNTGIKNFIKIRLKTFDSDTDARLYEEKLLKHFNARHNELFYNLTNGDADFVTKPQHGKVCLKGDDRTNKQKIGDKNKYKTRSEKRLLADEKHSRLMKQNINNGLLKLLLEGSKKWRKTPAGIKRWEEIKQELSVRKQGKNKNNDIGRQSTSNKLLGNENAKKGAIKLAYMSNSEFAMYLSTISQHPNIQKQANTRRAKGMKYIQTGIWVKHKRHTKNNVTK